ncbi:MAG TPA: glycosyltransferase family 2 protein [Symbiobacteriaceae bacterium]
MNSSVVSRVDAEQSVIIIPALDPPPVLKEYVTTLLRKGFPRVVVVNDGSRPEFAGLFAELTQTPGCLVLHHDRNRGKGAALKTALRYCLEQNWADRFRRAIMVDADGQHAVEDVCRMAAASARHPDAYVLGVRDFAEEIVPFRSRLGNRLTSGAFRLLYGRYLRDTQTGLRAVPSSLWPWALSIAGERFEYETNCLIQAVKQGVELAEVPIQTLYFNRNAGTHYRTFRDSWPIFLILVRNVGAYFLCSLLWEAVDLSVFWLTERRLFRTMAAAGRLLAASAAGGIAAAAAGGVLRRVLAVPANVGAGRLPAPRYLRMLAVRISAGYLLIYALYTLLEWPAVWLKVMADVVLGFAGYLAQVRGASRA